MNNHETSLISAPQVRGGANCGWIDGAPPRTVASWLSRAAAEAGASAEVLFLAPRLTLGGLAVVRERFPRPSRLRILLPRRALPAKGAEARAHYQLLATTPAELVLDSQLTQGADARRLHRWLAQEGVEVRTVAAEALLPGMAGVGEALLVGNPELTRECLGPTRMMVEAGLFAPDAASRAALLAVYERLWAQGTEAKEALRQRLLDYARPASPRFLYHLSLWHLFRDRLEAWRSAFVGDVRLAETPIWKALYPFQRHGAMAALRRLRKDGGCVLADSVGLGKTYTALAVIKAYERMGQGRVLVLCPKKLRANWERFLRPDAYNSFADVNGRPDFYYHVLNHTDLGRAAFETGHGKVEAERFWPRGFSLIVIDESHNFRNRGGQRYQFLLQHLREHRETHLLFLTATPVSNRLTDLTNQLGLIWRQDAAEPDLAFRRQEVGVLQAAQRRVAGYAKAHAEDPTAFSAATMAGLLGEAYFRLLSRTTIARSRAGIRLAYGGLSARWRVPECEIREAHPGLDLADRAFDVAALSERLNALTLAAYNPTEFLRAGVAWQEQANLSDRNRQRSLTALMRMNLLKRLESSIASFRKTAEEVLLRRTEEQQANLARGVVRVPWVTAKALLGEAEARRLAQASRGAAPSALPDGDILGEEEGEVSELLAREVDLPAERYFDVPALRKWLAADHAAVSAIVGKARAITPERDAKLQALCAVLEEKCRRPTNPGNAKALIFTAFADTAAYVAEALARRAPNRAIALVTGSDTRVWEGGQGKPETMARTLRRFAPDGQEVPKAERAGLPPVDWVVATDCLSEGQNLQDCDLVVNYDVHWNPLRLVQRIGRIDRIGSPNAYVRAVLFWPCAELNAYINLERRVRMKNAVSATVAPDGGVLGDDTRQDLAYRTRQLLAIQRGRLDLDAFVSGNRDRGFDDFLAELDVWLREGDNAKRCAAAPFGLCAVTTATLTEAFAREPLPDLSPKLMPNDLLRRRADIRMAEEDVHAQTAAIGVAEAELYPRFTLNGTLGISSPDLTPWPDYAQTVSFGLAVSWNIFGFGTWRKQVESAKATLEAVLADYRDTVLDAYREAETAWVACQREAERTADLRAAERNNASTLEIANQRYEIGTISIDDVLTRQSSLLSAQENLVTHRATLFTNAITLYRALGGGWADEPRTDADADVGAEAAQTVAETTPAPTADQVAAAAPQTQE